MSQQQQQPHRLSDLHQDPIKYGDVFSLHGDLADQPVRPRDAAMMQAAENIATGQTQKGAAASVMQSAATRNERAGLVGHADVTADTAVQGVSVAETDIPGRRVVRESVAGQTVLQVAVPTAMTLDEEVTGEKITVGEALEAAGIMQRDKPVEQSDAAAIQAAEARATGNVTMPGGVAAAAQSAAEINARILSQENKTTIGDVLANATAKLAADKGVTREDAERIVAAEIRNRPDLKTIPGGVAESVTSAACLNENTNNV